MPYEPSGVFSVYGETYVRGGLTWNGDGAPQCSKCEGPIVVTNLGGLSIGLSPIITTVHSDRDEQLIERRRDGHTVVWTKSLEARCQTLLMKGQ